MSVYRIWAQSMLDLIQEVRLSSLFFSFEIFIGRFTGLSVPFPTFLPSAIA